jgi:hypothetical protein
MRRRNAVRETWLSCPAEGVRAVFFHGIGKEPPENPNDTVVLDVGDNYDALPLKVRAFFQYAIDNYDFEWIFKCDDDTYLAMDRIASILDTRYDLIGDIMLEKRRAPSGGAGYFLSRQIVEKILAIKDFPNNGPEDLIVGKIVTEKLNANWLSSRQLCFDYSRMPRKDNDIVSCHWCSPQKLRTVHFLYQNTPSVICEGIHSSWHDKVLFFENGVFSRTTSGCTGDWKLSPSGQLTLGWHEWQEERLTRAEKNFLGNGFKLIPIQGDLSKINSQFTVGARSPVENSESEDTPVSLNRVSVSGKRILLFRCHTQLDKCRERLRILRYFNPELPVYILYGGSAKEEPNARRLTADFSNGFWSYPPGRVSSEWKWRRSDMLIREWFVQYGCKLDFTHLYSYEWDILTATPLRVIFPELLSGAVYVSPLRPFSVKLEKEWAWTKNGKWKTSEFQNYLRENYDIARPKFNTLGPGMILSREFLESYGKLPPLKGVHDEFAIPALAEAFGLPLMDSKLYTHPRNKGIKLWNTFEVKHGNLQNELMEKDGMRIFHPIKQMVSLENLQEWCELGETKGDMKKEKPISAELKDVIETTIAENCLEEFAVLNEIERLKALSLPVQVLEWGNGDWTRELREKIKIDFTSTIVGYEESTYPLGKVMRDGMRFDLILVDGRTQIDCIAVAALAINPSGAVFLRHAQEYGYRRNFSFFKKVEMKIFHNGNWQTAVLREPIFNISRESSPEIKAKVELPKAKQEVDAPQITEQIVESCEYPKIVTPKWGVCAVAIPRESYHWLSDWIEHHVKAGASKVVIYDNTGSTGSLRPGTVFANGALQRYKKSKRGEQYGKLTAHLSDGQISTELREIAASFENSLVEIFRWRPRNPANNNIIHGQVEAYCDFIRRFRDVLDWTAFLDLDEYLYCAPGLSVAGILRQLTEGAPAVAIVQLQSWAFECRWAEKGPKDIRELKLCIPVTASHIDKTFARLADVTHANEHLNWTLHSGRKRARFTPENFAFCHYNMRPSELKNGREYISPRAFLNEVENSLLRPQILPPSNNLWEGPLSPLPVNSTRVLQTD